MSNSPEHPERYRQFLEHKRISIELLTEQENRLWKRCQNCPLPENLRPALPEDIQVGAIIWYKKGDNGHFWQIVDEVLCPDDDFKAYCSTGGDRYGLHDAWVET